MSEYLYQDDTIASEDRWIDSLAADMQYGCIFCRTGQELIIAHTLTKKYDAVWALAVSQLKHKSINGVKSLNEQILLPGYVLFRSYEDEPPIHGLQDAQGVIRVMRNTSGDWRLSNDDRRFASWVFDQGGLIGISKAYAVGDKVRISSGPLKDYEGSIIKIDRRSRNGLVGIHFGERVWNVWLAFEVLDMNKLS